MSRAARVYFRLVRAPPTPSPRVPLPCRLAAGNITTRARLRVEEVSAARPGRVRKIAEVSKLRIANCLTTSPSPMRSSSHSSECPIERETRIADVLMKRRLENDIITGGAVKWDKSLLLYDSCLIKPSDTLGKSPAIMV